MRVKFLADVNFDRRIVDGVLRRESLVDFQTSLDANLSGKSDQDVLGIAFSLQRLLVTHDRKSMPKEFGRFLSNSQSYGVVVIPQKLDLRTGIDELLLIWAVSEAEDWLNVILSIPL